MIKNTAFVCSFVLLTIIGCKAPQQKITIPKSPVLATLGNKPVFADEYQYVYSKNSPSDSVKSEKKIREYLDLFINFKLKVAEAESMGLDTLSSFKSELEGYKQQLAQPYLTDKTASSLLVRQSYERMKEEIRASHILITVKEDANAEDTLKAYKQISEIRERAIKGQSFDELAKKYSQDPSASTNSGDLGYFTSMQMVYQFEDAAYKTQKGEISSPIRTKFGYHIIKVIDRRPSQGRVIVAHIMIRTNPNMPAEEAEIASTKINEIYNRLNKGEDWNKLCQQFSQDGSSNTKGGVLRQFGASELGIQNFEETAFSLKKTGEFSKPIQTPYGWHIIKLIEKQNLPTFTEMEPSLKQKVMKDSRSEINKTAFIEKLKRDNLFTENTNNLNLAFSKADTNLTHGKWNFNAKDKNLSKVLFNISNQKFTIEDFYNFLKKQQLPRLDLKPDNHIKSLYKEYVKRSLINFEENHLSEKYPDYKSLLGEYRDGILFFQRMQDEVWTKSLTDTIESEKYFNTNKEKYRWSQRVKAVIYDAANPSVINQVKEALSQKMYIVDIPDLGIIYFEKNKDILTEANNAILNGLIGQLKKDTTLLVEIAAHSDSKEKDGLAAKRAKQVSDYLITQGIKAKQVITKDFGKFKPVSKTERVKNSRVELTLYSVSKSALEKKINKTDPLRLQIAEGMFQKGDNKFLDGLNEWKVGTYNLEKNGRSVYIEILKLEEPRLKTFEEARGSVISDYQAYLEQKWIERLRQKYPVKINEKEVENVISKMK